MTKIKYRLLCCISIIALAIGLYSCNHVNAQQDTFNLDLIYKDPGLTLDYWDATSRYLYFDIAGVRDFIYDTAHDSVTSGKPDENITSFFQASGIKPTAAEVATFGIRGNIFFASPNGRYSVYLGSSDDPTQPGELWLADRESKLTQRTGFQVRPNTNPSVRWNSNSTLFSFIQGSQDGDELLGYGYIPASNFKQAKFETFGDLSILGVTYRLDNRAFFAQYDLAPDGKHIMAFLKSAGEQLAIGIIPVDDMRKTTLVQNIDADKVQSFAFKPNDMSKIWIVTTATFVEYDRPQQTQNTLFQASKDWIGQVSFSPDKHWLSLIHAAAFDELYIVGLSEFYTDKPTPDLPKKKKLQIQSMCSPQPDVYRLWKIHNPNDTDLLFSWDVYGSDLSGSLFVTANHTVDLETPKAPHNIDTLRVSINGVYQDSLQSLDETPGLCPSAVVTQPMSR